MLSGRVRQRCFGIAPLAAEYTRNAPNHAPEWQFSFGVREKDFPSTRSAVIPTLENCEVLHSLKSGLRISWRNRCQRFLYSRFHGLRFRMFLRLNSKWNWTTDKTGIDA